MTGTTHPRPPIRFGPLLAALLAVAVPVGVYLWVAAVGYDGGPYLRGDCPYYYLTAVSLIEDHDLDLGNQLAGRIFPGEVSLDRHGRIVPKHPLPLAIAALPLIATLGAPGALVFNLVQLTGLLALLFVLTRRLAGDLPATVATLATGVGSFLPHYAWNFSPDVFTTLLVVAALVAGPGRRPLAAGALLGVAIVTKLPVALFALAAPLLLLSSRWRSLARLAVGLALPLCGYALLNLHLFGSPWTTSYDRILAREGGRWVTTSHRDDFRLANLAAGLAGELTDPTHGLLATAPLTLPAYAGLIWLARRDRSLAAYLGSTALASLLLYAGYSHWSASHYGNRFLMPSVVLSALPLAALVSTLGSGPAARTRPTPGTAGAGRFPRR